MRGRAPLAKESPFGHDCTGLKFHLAKNIWAHSSLSMNACEGANCSNEQHKHTAVKHPVFRAVTPCRIVSGESHKRQDQSPDQLIN